MKESREIPSIATEMLFGVDTKVVHFTEVAKTFCALIHIKCSDLDKICTAISVAVIDNVVIETKDIFEAFFCMYQRQPLMLLSISIPKGSLFFINIMSSQTTLDKNANNITSPLPA